MASEDDWARVADAAGRRGAVLDRDAVVQVAINLGLTVAPGVVGCSVTQRAGEGYRTLVSAADLATAMDLAQYDAGAGPCMVAASEGRIERLDAADRESGYPGFAAAAARHGVRSSLSLPLAGGEPAALNFYAAGPAAFSSERPRQVADLLARCMVALLHDGLPESIGSGGSAGAPMAAEDMAAALTRRRVIRDAEDALMVGERLSRADAFARLIQRSKTETRSIFGVAADLLARASGERKP